MRVAVLGAGGTIAPAIVRDLAESEEVTAMRLLDIDLRRAEAVAMEHGGGKAQARQADATADLAEQLAGMEVLVNSAAYRINLAAMRGLPGGRLPLHRPRRALPRDRGAARALRRVRAARPAGAAGDAGPPRARPTCWRPGRSRSCRASPISISVLAGGPGPRSRPGELSFPYALRTLLDEITMPPMALINGRPEEMKPLQDGPRADFGDPIGEAETIFTLHSEVLTFGDSFGAPNVTFALSLPPAVLESLKELSGASEERIAEVARSASPPSANTTVDPHRRGQRPRHR